jgi:hypothetical protein
VRLERHELLAVLDAEAAGVGVEREEGDPRDEAGRIGPVGAEIPEGGEVEGEVVGEVRLAR